MNYQIFLDFIYNVSLILAVSVIYMLLPKEHFEPKGWERFVYGAVVSVLGIIVMSNPHVVLPGVQFDARSLVVSSCAMFLGIVPTIIATIITSAYRLFMGGDGAVVGVLVIISSAFIGLLWRTFFYKRMLESKRKRLLNLYITGLIIHAVYLFLLIFLPGNIFGYVFSEISFSLIIVYPIGSVILGLVLFSQYEKLSSRKELSDTKDRLFRYIEEAPYAIFILDDDGRFTDANKKAAEVSGYSIDELILMTTADITADDNTEENKASFEKLRTTGVLDINKRYITKDKGIRTWNVRAVKLGENMYVSFVNDITDILHLEDEKKRFDMAMRNQQKLESIGTLAGGVAHEINNPINGILNYGQLILDSDNSDDEINEYASEIIHESNRIAGIVRNLLAFSRSDVPDYLPYKINDMLTHTLALVRALIKGDQIELQTEMDPGLPELVCNCQQIQQVILNLLTNARDALNEKFEGYHRDKIIRISCSVEIIEGQKKLAIRVRDNGNGIRKDIQDKIFDPFFTSKDRNIGTGLGLAISYGIVRDHGGKIGFTTKEGEFTEFYVLLPLS